MGSERGARDTPGTSFLSQGTLLLGVAGIGQSHIVEEDDGGSGAVETQPDLLSRPGSNFGFASTKSDRRTPYVCSTGSVEDLKRIRSQ